jgi:hypothetical protein
MFRRTLIAYAYKNRKDSLDLLISKNMDNFCLQNRDDDDEVSLDLPSTTKTILKNVFRHVTVVLQRECRHSTAIGTELSKPYNPTAYTV